MDRNKGNWIGGFNYQNKTASNKEIEDLVRLNFDSKDTALLNSNSRKFKDKYIETIDAAIILLENNSKLIDFTNANYIYSIISGIVDYFNNLNPFPSTPSFKPYFDEWKKKAAAVKPMADQLPANFNTNYTISIKNQLDKLRKRM